MNAAFGARIRTATSLAVLSLVVLSGAGCADEDVIEVGMGYYSNGAPMIEAPAAVPAGATFAVRVTTGGSSCVSADHIDIEATADGAIVTPYDRRQTDHVCLELLYPIDHETSLSFATPGTATLHVHLRTSGYGVEPVVLQDVPLSITVE